MYLWNAKALATDLREGRVAESDKLRYVLVALIYSVAFGAPGAAFYVQYYPVLILYALLLAVFATGVAAAFRANAQGDGEHFLDRFVCLSVALFPRWFVVLWIGKATLTFALRRSGIRIEDSNALGWAVWLVPGLAAYGLFYYWLREYMGAAANRPGSSASPAGV